MIYTNLGQSGLRVSRIALGCMGFGDPNRGRHSWTLDAPSSYRILEHATGCGINFYDTANVYSLGSSEQIVGEFLHAHGLRRSTILATKVYERMTDSPISGGLSRRSILEEVENSLSRLKTDYIDLYIIHRWDYNTPIEETMRTLDMLIKSGTIRYIGASSMKAWQFAKAQYLADRLGLTRFISMQSHYNLLAREEEREMLPLCRAEGVGVTPWSPLARGKLAGRSRVASQRENMDDVSAWLYTGANGSDDKILDALEAIAFERNVACSTIALAWLLNKAEIAAPIIGATKCAHISDAVAALEIVLSSEEATRLEEAYIPRIPPEYS